MRYLPHTDAEVQAMLKTIGVSSVDDLFNSIPDEVRFKGDLALPKALDEVELLKTMKHLAEMNIHLDEGLNFIGAGSYYHYVPSVIESLVKRGEFLTAYTPYQPEVSQGTLQAIYEFQTMMAELTGMDVANASNYDLSTACAEAVMMANRINQKKRVLISQTVHPHYRDVLKTYFANQDLELIELPYDQTGVTDLKVLKEKLTDDISAVLIQSPNFFGRLEELSEIGDLLKDKEALFIHATSESLAYSVLASSGEVGADIAIGEGMSFGLGNNFGGPYLGIFATKEKYVRQMPGRLVGETTDLDGKRGYVLTFATREQHIRREKATSNICTNQGLCALICSIYLSLMGPTGLEKLALLNMNRLAELKNLILKKAPVAIAFEGPNFNELVIRLNQPVKEVVMHLLKDRIFSGVDLSTYYPELENHLLICTTEMISQADVKMFVERLSPFLSS